MDAIGFDLGDTLIYYDNIPLSWKELYKKAFLSILQELNVVYDDAQLDRAENVLSKYNTRLFPRVHEYTDKDIFAETFYEWNFNDNQIDQAIHKFFDFFQQKSKVYDDTVCLLKALKENNYRTGILTDVPYGMSKKRVMRDIEPIKEYVGTVITSGEIGYRKPRPEGYLMLADELFSEPNRMMFIGNEQKDILGANLSGMRSVLINRSNREIHWEQDITVYQLTEILDFF